MTDRVRFRGTENFMVGMALAVEAGATFAPMGGNEADVDLAPFDDEQREALAELVRDPLPSPAVPSRAADDTGAAVGPVGDPPPKTGTGATRVAWAAYADRLGVTYPDDAGRDDIIERVEAHGGS